MINFTDLINKLNEYNNNILQENEKYKKENEELKLQISNLTSKESHNNLLLEKYKKENEEYKNKINTLEEDNTNFKKVSFVQSMNKQLTEKMNYITILEGQLQKYKNKDEIILEVKQNSSIKEEENKEESVKQNKEESVKENTKDTNNKSKKKKEDKIEDKIEDKKEDKVEEKNIKEKYSNETEFNPDEYEDINGYELLCYKKKYYLRDLETSEIYDINDYKPNKIVGLITKGGKMKLNK
jgi:hypothetical protein